ncbi:ErfK/YbiS/YcfS/YnhG family protein [Ammonifex degensii KC4]|uniref:ErfK/YbiS/YcfS/YnhG family protein n=1 Tax=Ammonifex degensii (strain DSM 10501 / KC4) TaxID=429009 RepID=C9RBK0_AMMDK|nr:L,D-transpeptidase family protein [Ammonifex degensii]ACX51627.1 ErfK/YbiS/YcfS/YnhG family protein [Ammonifex degensii KC4]
MKGFLLALMLLYLPTGNPEANSSLFLVVDTWQCRLLVFSEDRLVKVYPVAVGKAETPTPVGNWSVTRKAMNWGSGFGTRWIGLDVPWGIYGLHGTNKPWSIGRTESQGCIRMFNRDIEELYPRVRPGTPVIVVGKILRGPRVLREGDCGSDVMEVQRVLRRQGFYSGPISGRFDAQTKEAVRRFQQHHRLPSLGEVDEKTYELLGL